MATITIRNLPDRTVSRLKKRAKQHHRSMEQEVRDILEQNLESRSEVLARIEARAKSLPSPTKEEVDEWIADSRYRKSSTRLNPQVEDKPKKPRRRSK